MWKVFFILMIVTAGCEPYTKKHKTTPNRNQRIIKVQGPPHFNHFHGHQKPIRKRPFGVHPGDEFIRPNHPPPIPPFFNGPSTNHIKHLPRPPPHVFHKSPSYGLGFPYKSLTSYSFVKRPTKTKDQFRVQSISTLPIRHAAGSATNPGTISTSTTYNSPTFMSSTPFISSPMPHIISSDDNNGPIREIPAPNLAPKSHESPFGSISIIGDVSGIGAVNGLNGVGSIKDVNGIGGIGIEEVNGISGIKIQEGDIRGINGVLHGLGEISGNGGTHGVSDISGAGEIHDVNGEGGDVISNVASVGGVTHLEPEALLHTVANNPNGINLDAIVKDQGIEVNPYVKESGSDLHHGKGPTVEIANFDEGSSIDVTNLIKDAAGSSDHHSGYEVTEHHNHLPTNDQVIKSHDGTKLYYAPDPDPSLPVHKVPPTNDPHSTPSNGQNINNIYVPQITHKFPYLHGGSVGGHLSSQELFQLMHGYPAMISQPVVAFVSQPQASGIILPGSGHNYFQQNAGPYSGGHYSQDSQEGNDISQYLQQPEIHNLLHNSPQETIDGSHSSVVSQSIYSPQNQYQGYLQPQLQYQTSLRASDLGTTKRGNFATSDINHNYQYEPEASETDNRNSLTVIRQTNEGTLNSETVKELLLEDPPASEPSQRGKDASGSVPTILQLKNIPEVPFYATLPSKKAAEALATLQAAGSVASNYMKKIKITRGDQQLEEENHERERKSENEFSGNEGVDYEELKEKEKTVIEIQQSVPLYETSISSKNLIEDDDQEQILESDTNFDTEGQYEEDLNYSFFKENNSNETFGKRIRPK